MKMNHAEKRHGPNQRPKITVDYLRTKAWYFLLALFFDELRGKQIEMRLLAEENDSLTEEELLEKCTNRFIKYMKGRHLPREKLVSLISTLFFPDAERLFNHPLWKVLEVKELNMKELHEILANLRPEVSELLFYLPRPNEASYYRRKPYSPSILKKLVAYSTIDAFTACLGLIQEERLYGNHHNQNVITNTAMVIFYRIATLYPFIFIRHEFEDYMLYTFINFNYAPIWIFKYYGIGDYEPGTVNIIALFIANDSGVLKHFESAPFACIDLVLPDLTPNLLDEIAEASEGRDEWRSFLKRPIIKNIKRRIRRWESKVAKTKEYYQIPNTMTGNFCLA